MKEELRKRAFVPQHLLGTIHDPMCEVNEASRRTEKSPVERLERSGNTVVAFPKKLLAA
jgi:hypothetical protein